MTKYKKIKLKDGTTIDEHRLIMQNYLGRKLTRYEVVHHKNENTRDNRIENLEIMSLSNHSRQHMIGKKSLNKIIAPEGKKWCWSCKQFKNLDEFSRYAIEKRTNKECRTCNTIMRRRYK